MEVASGMLKWWVICALFISMLSSVILLVISPEATHGDTLNLLFARHVTVCLPLLPISVFVSSEALHMVCNAYLAATIQHRFTFRAGAQDEDEEEDEGSHSKGGGGGGRSASFSNISFLKQVSQLFSRTVFSLRARAGLREGSEADNVTMLGEDAEALRLREARKGSGTLQWRSVLTHIAQRLKIPKADYDRSAAASIINPCADLVETLGSATVLSFPDVEGIVCEPLLSPKQILLLSPTAKSGEWGKGRGGEDASSVKVIELLCAAKGAPPGACSFQDAVAIEQYLSQLKPLGLNCLLNTNAHSDAYTTFIESTLRDLVQQRQAEGCGGLRGVLSGAAGGHPGLPGMPAGGGGATGGGGGGCFRFRSDPYVDIVSCDSCDASHFLAPVIGFSPGVASSFNRLLELQILVRPSAAAVLDARMREQQLHHQQWRGSSACGTPGGTNSVHSGGSPTCMASTLFALRPPREAALITEDRERDSATLGLGGTGQGFVPARSVTGSEQGEAKHGGKVEAASPHMMGVVVEDSQQQLQLFVKGDVDPVLRQCSQVWDGHELRPMKPEDMHLILRHCSECYQKHYKCVAFSYVALGADRRELIKSCSQLGRSVFLDQDEMGGLTMFGASDWQLPPSAQVVAGPGAFSWRRPKTQPAKTLSSISEELLQEHIFIGMLTMRYRPYSEITEAMDILSEAGIRFVFFSEMQEEPTVAVGNQLGLWSDWNCCISLRDLPPPPRSIPPSPGAPPGSGISGGLSRNANYSHAGAGPRLPHGIRAIRRHITEADDVPLRVSMFCDSSPETITSMVAILQENGERVVSCGSSRNVHNLALFAAADLSMSVAPQPPSRQYSHMYGDGARVLYSGLHTELAEGVTSVPCALNMRRKFSMEELIGSISTARTLLEAMRQACVYGLTVSLLLMSVALMSNLMMLPHVLLPLQIIWHLVLIAPCFLCAILFSGQRISARVKSANPMRLKLLRSNNKASFWKRPQMQRLGFYMMIRFIPTSCVLIGIFVDGLSKSFSRHLSLLPEGLGKDAAGPACMDFRKYDTFSMTNILQLSAYLATHQNCKASNERFLLALAEARQLVDIMVVVTMAVLSIGSLHRTASLLDLWRHCKYIWMTAVLAAAAIQSLLSAVAMQQSYGGMRPTLEHVPPSVIVLMTIWPSVILCVDEAIRHHDRKKVRRLQQRLTLEFETLLGQTSPK